jgi:hypothetical protein
MMAFIDQEASEKVEEIDAKVMNNIDVFVSSILRVMASLFSATKNYISLIFSAWQILHYTVRSIRINQTM